MTGIGPEGNPEAAPEPVVAEPITLTPEQVDSLLSRYSNVLLGHDRALHGENPLGEDPNVNIPLASDVAEHRRVFSGMITVLEDAFRIIGISDRARQVREEVTFGEFDRRFGEFDRRFGEFDRRFGELEGRQ